MRKIKMLSFLFLFVTVFAFSSLSTADAKGWKKLGSCGKDDAQGLKDPKTKKSFIQSTNKYGNPCKPGKVVDLQCKGGKMMAKCG